MEEQQDYDIWATFFRLIVCYDYSMFLNYIIPSIAAFWKSRKYEIDQKYGVLVVQPKIIELVLELRTNLIKFMKESYGPSDHVALTDAEEEKNDAVMANYANMDLGVWPTSKVSLKRHGWPKSLKPYEEKWNSLFDQKDIRDHFKQKVYKESLFLVGALYNFFKYNQ
jgi:hypothetical protein